MNDTIEEIISIEKQADDLYHKSSALHWRAAELIATEIKNLGVSQREFAKLIGKSVAHVNKCIKIWEQYCAYSPEDRPDWQDAYRARSGKGNTRETKPEAEAHVTDVDIIRGTSVENALSPQAWIEAIDKTGWTTSQVREAITALLEVQIALEQWLGEHE